MSSVLIARFATSPFGRIASIAGAAILPHLPCVLIASGIWTLGAGAAAFLTNPWTVGVAVFASLWTGTIAHRKICDWRCAFDACVPSSNLQTTVNHKSFGDLAIDTSRQSRAKMHRNAVLCGVYTGVAAASAVYLPPVLHGSNTHCHINSIDYNRSVLLSCPNNTGSILVTISNANQVVFVDGKDIGAQRMEMCNAPSQIWMPHRQPSSSIKPLTAEEAGALFRTWSCCTTEKMMKAIDAGSVDPYTRAALKQAVQNAWQGENLDAVHCPNPQVIKQAQESGRGSK